MRSSWPPACNARSPPAKPTAARPDPGREVPGRKSLEDVDFDHARGLKRETIAHLGTLDFVTGRDNVVFLGPPGTGKTHLATGLAIRACQAGHRVAFATASSAPSESACRAPASARAGRRRPGSAPRPARRPHT